MVNLTTGYWVSQMIGVTAELGIADLLKDGPRDARALAASVRADPDALYRLMRALSSVGLFAEDAEHRFQLTPLGDCLRSDAPGSMRAWARTVVMDYFVRSYQDLMYSVKTGKPAFDHVHGMGPFEYFSRNLEVGRLFDEAMTSFSSVEIPAVIAAYDFSPIRNLVDIAGGHASLLCAVLKKNPTMQGVLFDMPTVVDGARDSIAAEGLSARCEVIGGDMFHSVPAGGDAYMMKHIIHDWNDERCVEILKNCRSAMPSHGRVLIIDAVIQAGNQPDSSKLLDITMLTINGRERTEEQFHSLLDRAGFNLSRIVPTQSPVSVVEGIVA